MDISIILSTYKRHDILEKMLKSFLTLETGNLRWECIIVDNAGDELTKKIVDKYMEKLPLIFLIERKPGKNNALNSALPIAKGDLFVFTDDDILASQDWLVQLWEGAQRWSDYVVFGGRILPDWPEGFEPYDLQNSLLIGAYGIANWDFPEGEYSPKKLFGANMAVRREIFDRGWRFEGSIGPNQKSNYIMGSETEFVLRLKSEGYSSVYLPNSLVYHQIRPNQMGFDWLKQRAYRAGRGTAKNDEISGDVKMLFGYPRYLIRSTIETFLSYLVSLIFNKKKKTQYGMRFHYNLGRIAQYKLDIIS